MRPTREMRPRPFVSLGLGHSIIASFASNSQVAAQASNAYFASVSSNSYALGGVVVGNAAASNTHFVATSPTTGLWLPHTDTGEGAGDGDEKAKVSSNDTTAGYLNGKLVAGTGITLTENNNGSNETLSIATAAATTSVGLVDTIAPEVSDFSQAPANTEALPTSGGTIAVPFKIAGPMKLRTVFLRSTDTASARAAEYRLYYYNTSSGNLEFVTGTDGTFSFTPVAASDRSSTISGSPVDIAPGTYWLAIRNTSGAQSFGIAYNNLSSTFWNATTSYFSQTLGSALGSTLTQSGWSAGSRGHAIRLRGGNFGA